MGMDFGTFMLALTPAIALFIIVGFELPESFRRVLFKLPIFVICIAYGLFVKMTLSGVLGSYGIFITDIATYPLLYILALRTKHRTKVMIQRKPEGLQNSAQ